MACFDYLVIPISPIALYHGCILLFLIEYKIKWFTLSCGDPEHVLGHLAVLGLFHELPPWSEFSLTVAGIALIKGSRSSGREVFCRGLEFFWNVGSGKTGRSFCDAKLGIFRPVIAKPLRDTKHFSI